MANRRQKLRVLHLIESLGSGGAERLLFTNLKYLDSDAVHSDVVTVFDHEQYWRDPIEELGVGVNGLGCASNRDIPAGVRRLRKRIRDLRPDLIHTHLFAANIIGRMAGRFSGIPVISSVHNPEYEREACDGAPSSVLRKIAAARVVDKITAPACARMIAVSEYVKQSAIRWLGYPAAKIEVVYNPIDTEDLAAASTVDPSAVRASLDLDEDAVFLLHVGRLTPQKGFRDAVRAMPDILRSSRAHLFSVGAQADAEYRSKVVQAIESLDLGSFVHLAGERRDVPSLMSTCDVFVFPSRFEGLGIALIEAMAAGRACVASDIAPLTEFVQHGVNGLLVPPGDASGLAKAVTAVSENEGLRNRLGSAARCTALDRFQPGVAAAKLAKIYFSTVN